MADYDDIVGINDSMPYFPNGMNIFQKVMCLFGYHKWEKRESKDYFKNGWKVQREEPLCLGTSVKDVKH